VASKHLERTLDSRDALRSRSCRTGHRPLQCPHPPSALSEETTLRKSRVLIVDDEELYRRSLERILARVGHEVLMARDAGEAVAIVAAQSVDLVLCDVKMPGINGLELVRQLKDLAPDLPCIVITGYSTAETSIEALRAGAFWYLQKPFEHERLDVIRRLVDQAIEHGRLKAENRLLHNQLRSKYKFDSIVGKGGALQKVLRLVEKVADTHSTVLITGESGTGKELIARAIHYNSPRADCMLVTVNCGAIPEELLESELFGHVKGAFTNAIEHREGRFSVADGGTLFLDEIGDMSPNLQVKLLRVLQEKTFEPVGSSKTEHVDVRVIAATNQNLKELIASKRFREDLYYRLNVLPVEMPPLRDRPEDVPLLVHHFLDRARTERGSRVEGVSDELMQHFIEHDWPGNIRELENLIGRLLVLHGDGTLELDTLPTEFQAEKPQTYPAPRVPASGIDFKEVIDQLEVDLILQALERTHWNKNQAARLLGLNRTTLEGKIRKRGLSPPGDS
jgi:DNA-binding NtrC family response regulator